ncbi:MAG: hypothetical protein UR23_C0050G0001 [Candidatus Roizmanbacteria bacterium GW2011_GWA2_32_13]|uniref:Uncharacterized protein n=1 Tax=Candidatus Roizmanbacteria bacterium GW2011_GWA2_32_13 TaxID=1618475 RepID=A0A0F9YNS9_9BACT|nr:MAG: hypothetical protein UR23_C0050G0001 [Candidatus Roizmanbacteria bacterium GW2011_GWA2_32_13]
MLVNLDNPSGALPNANLLSPNKLEGFKGISFFESIDGRFKAVDTGPRNLPGSMTVHFNEKSGQLYYLESNANKIDSRSGIGFNLRTGEYYSFQEKGDPKKDPRILKALELLGYEYNSWLDNPPGYPEVEKIFKDVTSGKPIELTNLNNAVKKGEYLLFYDSLSRVHACKVLEIQSITDMPIAKGGYRILTDSNGISINISQSNFETKQDVHDTNEVVGAVVPKDSEIVLNKDEQGIWRITKEEFELLDRYSESKRDPSIEYPLSREEFVIASALDGMAFERWGASIESIRSKNPGKYSGISKENLLKAIGNLVSRFGEPALAKAVLYNAYQHIFRLHTPNHRTKIVGAQNNVFGDVHSDILGFKRDISHLVKDLTGNIHPITDDMERDGYGTVGQGVYNVKSIFGDLDMLEILKVNYPETFNQLVKFLSELAPIDQGDWYGNSTVFPLRAIKEYFPEAYDYMKKNFEGTLSEEEGSGIKF